MKRLIAILCVAALWMGGCITAGAETPEIQYCYSAERFTKEECVTLLKNSLSTEGEIYYPDLEGCAPDRLTVEPGGSYVYDYAALVPSNPGLFLVSIGFANAGVTDAHVAPYPVLMKKHGAEDPFDVSPEAARCLSSDEPYEFSERDSRGHIPIGSYGYLWNQMSVLTFDDGVSELLPTVRLAVGTPATNDGTIPELYNVMIPVSENYTMVVMLSYSGPVVRAYGKLREYIEATGLPSDWWKDLEKSAVLSKIDLTTVNFGDADGDGKANAADALAVLKDAVNKQKIEDPQTRTLCDMDGDGLLNAADALMILKKAVGKKLNTASPLTKWQAFTK